MDRIRILIDKLEGALKEPACPLSGVIQDCLTLARLAGEPEWEVYFNLQLLGHAVKRHPMSSPPISSVDQKSFRWQPVIRFAEDREGVDKHIQVRSVQQLETFIQTAESALSQGDDDLVAQLKEHNIFYRVESSRARAAQRDLICQAREFLDIARNRAREFVGLMEVKEHTAMPQEAASLHRVFIGHGHATTWYQLANFVRERLSLACEEFNRESVAGRTTVERLQEMLERATFAFIVFTGEDEGPDGSLHARESVVHEAGLFQGRLGFKKAIILLEEGCEEFSNIQGLGEIRFPRGDLRPAFEEIRRVLEREGLVEGSTSAQAPNGQATQR